MKRMFETLAAAVLLMLLWHILPGQAFAAEQVNLTMEMDKQDYIHRETVTVTIENDAQLTNQGVGITLYFDEEVLDFDRQNSTAQAPLKVYGPLKLGEKTAVRISCFPGAVVQDFSNEEPLATLKFQAIGAAAEGSSIEMAPVSQYKAAAEVKIPEEPLAFTVTSIPVERILLNHSTMELETNKAAALEATIQPQDATNQTVIWTTTDETVATVENGRVTAVSVGTAIITAISEEDESIFASCTVTVKAPYDAGYKVRMPADKQGAVGETILLAPTITNQELDGYNAYAFTFSYDPRYLTLLEGEYEDIQISETEVSNQKHIVEVLRYGEKISFVEGKSIPFELSFRTLTSGNTDITLLEARIDHSGNALVQNASLATAEDAVTTVYISGYPVTYNPNNLFNGPAYVVVGNDLQIQSLSPNYQYCFAGTKMNGQTQKIWYEFRDSSGNTIEDSEINRENGYVHPNSKIQDVVMHFGGADKADESDLFVYLGTGGRFLIPNINGPLAITAASAGKYYTVVKNGSAAESFIGAAEAQYGEDYVLTQKDNGNFTLILDGLDAQATLVPGRDSVSGKTIYTLDGQYITSDFSITINGEAGGGSGDNDDPDAPDDPDEPSDPDAPAEGYQVTVSGTGVTLVSGNTAAAGDNVTFRLEEEDIYDYTWKVFIGQANKTSKVTYDAEADVYTIPASLVTDEIRIEVTKRELKEFTVTVSGTGKSEVESPKTASYGTDLEFDLNKTSGYTYTVTITIGDKKYSDYEQSGSSYTIPGEDIRGDITIKVVRTKSSTTTGSGTTTGNKTTSTSKTTSTNKNALTVTFEGSGAENVTAESTATRYQSYTFQINQQPGFGYNVTATVNEKAVSCNYKAAKGEYTIFAKDVTGNIVITVEMITLVETSEYITLNGKSIFLVSYQGDVEKDQVPQYDGNEMYWSDAYHAYVWLVASGDTDEQLQKQAEQKIGFTRNNVVVKVDCSGNVDQSMAMDLSDARLVLDIYRGKYDLDNMQMQNLLGADVVPDRKINLQDVLCIVTRVLQQEEGGSVGE